MFALLFFLLHLRTVLATMPLRIKTKPFKTLPDVEIYRLSVKGKKWTQTPGYIECMFSFFAF